VREAVREAVRDAVALLAERDVNADADAADEAVGAGLELPTGCALPPAQALGGVHGAHVPVVPAQRMLPSVVDA
jgi:hypothetical protein